jgi:hypothetical protein
MKKSLLLICCAAALGLTACYKSVMDPLSGIYPAPTVITESTGLNSASATSVKGDNGRLIDVDLIGIGVDVHLAMVGNKFFLSENTYIEAQESAAKNGNFIIGKTKVNGKGIESGRIVVSRDPVDTEKKSYTLDDIYTIKCVLFAEDGTPFKVEWSGKLAFYPDPVLGDIIIENVITDAVSETAAGLKKHLMNLVDDSGNPSGTFEIFVDPAATTIAGTYICKEYAENLGEAGLIANGYNFPDWGISGGSYYMKDGVRVDINAGQTVVIAPLSDKSYIFNVDGVEFVAAGTELGEGIIFEYGGVDTVSATDAGKVKHLVNVNLDGEAAGTFELFCEPETNITGTYLCKEYAETLGESLIIANGYNFPDWGISGGSYYMKDGTRVDINAGEIVTVARAGEKLYSFCGAGFTYLVRF